jgi:toxin ParE1/3/4
VRWTLEAERWLREIHDHIAEDNPEAAIRTVRGIFERAQTLACAEGAATRARGAAAT